MLDSSLKRTSNLGPCLIVHQVEKLQTSNFCNVNVQKTQTHYSTLWKKKFVATTLTPTFSELRTRKGQNSQAKSRQQSTGSISEPSDHKYQQDSVKYSVLRVFQVKTEDCQL